MHYVSYVLAEEGACTLQSLLAINPKDFFDVVFISHRFYFEICYLSILNGVVFNFAI